MTRVVTALVVVIVAGVACRGVGAFSLGRLFPASRRGVRGTLLSSIANSKVPSGSMKDAMKQAIIKSQSKQEAIKQNDSFRQEAVKQQEAVRQQLQQQQELVRQQLKEQQEAVRQQVKQQEAERQQLKQQQETVRQQVKQQQESVRQQVKQPQEAVRQQVKQQEAFKESKDTTTTTVKPRVPLPVTDSPIYYIRLPPSPYVYMPGLGYVSPNRNHFTFLRPDVNFVNNGKPTNVFHFKAPVTTPYFHTTTPSTTTTSTTTTTTTTTPRPTTAKPQKPPTTKKPSPITWLTGPWFFNGRPSNLFIYRSPYNPGHLDKLHKTYSKPGVYVK